MRTRTLPTRSLTLHRRIFSTALLLFSLAIVVCAQETAEPQRTEPEGWDAGNQAALPADRLVDILRQQPEALVALKRITIRYLQEQGRTVTDSELTDHVLLARVQQDVQVRRLLTRELRTRGYLTEDDLDYLDRRGSDPSAKPPSQPIRRLQTSRPPEDQNQPATTRKPNPYPGSPALQDLYRQIPSPAEALQRFGADIFLNGTGNLDTAPMDLPAGPDYVLGSGDGLNIQMWGSVSQRFIQTVDREGRIVLPEVGTIVVAGETLASAQQLIQKTLATQFRDAKADVSLTRLRMVRVYVVGDVERPGVYDISALSTPLNALARCTARQPSPMPPARMRDGTCSKPAAPLSWPTERISTSFALTARWSARGADPGCGKAAC